MLCKVNTAIMFFHLA